MQHQFKNNYIVFIVISLIALHVHTSELSQDSILIIFKDVPYRDITSFTLTNKYYNQTVNASFYEKLINRKTPTCLQRQLAYDEDLFKNMYRTQIKRYRGLSKEEQKSFGLKNLFEIKKPYINRLISSHICAKYPSNRSWITLEINNKNLSFFKKQIELTEFTPEEQIAFFSDSPQPTKFEQAINDLPLLMEKIETNEIEFVKELLKKHDNFIVIKPSILLEFLCKLGNYEIIKNFINVDRSEIIKTLNSIDVSTDNYKTNQLLDCALKQAYLINSLSLFTDLINTTEIIIDCGLMAPIVRECINNKEIEWVRVIESKREKEIKQKIVNQYFTSTGDLSNYKDYNNITLFEHACNNGTQEIIELLLPYGPEHATEVALEAACNRKDKELVNWLLETKDDFNSIYKSGNTLLQHIIKNKYNTNEEIIISLAKKTDITIVDSQKKTLLHLALDNRLEKLAQFLVTKKANVNAQDDYQKTPLHYAISSFHHYCSLKMIEFLLNNGADPNLADSEGKPPLFYAFSYPKAERQQVINLLITYNANIHYKCKNQSTALHDACKNECSIETLQCLIDNKFDINAQDGYGNTPLHYSCNNLNIAQFLLNNGADVSKPNYRGKSPLDYCHRGNIEGYWDWDPHERYSTLPLDIIELLVQNGANIFYTMEGPYDKIACICLLHENEETLQTLAKLFTQLEPVFIKEKAINILIGLAQRNNNTQTIDFLTSHKLTPNQERIPNQLQETVIREPQTNTPALNQFQPPKTTVNVLQKYAPYLCMPFIGAILLFLAKNFIENNTLPKLFTMV